MKCERRLAERGRQQPLRCPGFFCVRAREGVGRCHRMTVVSLTNRFVLWKITLIMEVSCCVGKLHHNKTRSLGDMYDFTLFWGEMLLLHLLHVIHAIVNISVLFLFKARDD